MSYFRDQIDRFSSRYGHLTGTLLSNTLYDLEHSDGFGSVGNILACKRNVEETLDLLNSIRKHCELIDEFSGSNRLQTIDRLRKSFRDETLSMLDLAMKHTIRKEFDSAVKLVRKIRTQLSKYTDDILELISLKESFDVSKLPLDYVEFFETGEMKFIGRIFLSYSIKPENEELIDGLAAPFLEELGFQTVYAKRDFPPIKTPGQSAEELIKKCGTLIAFLTKDQDSYPSANVIHEIGIASDKVVIMFAEKGARVPTNLTTSGTYYTFERQHLEKMLLRLLRCLRLSNVFKSPKP